MKGPKLDIDPLSNVISDIFSLGIYTSLHGILDLEQPALKGNVNDLPGLYYRIHGLDVGRACYVLRY